MQSNNFPLTTMTLDVSTALKLTMDDQMCKERELMARNDAWHRVKIIKGARFEKEAVLKAVLAAVEPADLIPVNYQVNGEDSYFMARNCGPALEMLCRSNLIIKMPSGDAVVIIVTLAFASIHHLKINIQPIILSALTKRYNSTTKYLRLDNFHRDSEIAKTVYCPLSQMKTLRHTLKIARTALGPFEYLNLQCNNLTSLAALENQNLVSVRGLDIRNNNILAMDVLTSLNDYTITEIWLDGNPLCENYATVQRYVESVKLYCPHVRMIDGIHIDSLEFPLSRKYYYKADSDARRIIEQFFTHFFTIYDRKDRRFLSGLYHKNAVYSQTLGAVSNMINRENVATFVAENRNILDSPSLTKKYKLLHCGIEQIISALKRLPGTVHNRKNVVYDIMFEDYKHILVSVEGTFKTTSGNSILSFSRTFLLIGADNNEYSILNDQCHIDTASPTSTFYEVDEETSQDTDSDTELSPRKKEDMIYSLMDVTTMTTEWCHRFLNDADWDARRALKTFIENYKSSKIPKEAFGR